MSESALRLNTVESPCVGICRLDDGGVCIGCFRTGDEIASWLSYSDEQRRAVMKALRARADRRFDDP